MDSPKKRPHVGTMSDQLQLQDHMERPPRKSRTRESSHECHEADRSSRGGSARYHSLDEIPRTPNRRDFNNADGRNGILEKRQKKILRVFYEEFAQHEGDPTISADSMFAFAKAISARPHLVSEYIQSRRSTNDDTYQDNHNERGRFASRSVQGSDTESERYSLTESNHHLSPEILKLVEKYVAACRRRRSQNDGRRSVNSGPYRCTFGCGYRTKRAFDWRRHEETHEPQELWLCSLCIDNDTQNPFLVNRKDKFLKHVTDKHGEVSAEKILDRSKLPFIPRAELNCFHCGLESGSWDERCRHVLGHYEDEVARGMRRVKVIQEDGSRSDHEYPSVA